MTREEKTDIPISAILELKTQNYPSIFTIFLQESAFFCRKMNFSAGESIFLQANPLFASLGGQEL